MAIFYWEFAIEFEITDSLSAKLPVIMALSFQSLSCDFDVYDPHDLSSPLSMLYIIRQSFLVSIIVFLEELLGEYHYF